MTAVPSRARLRRAPAPRDPAPERAPARRRRRVGAAPARRAPTSGRAARHPARRAPSPGRAARAPGRKAAPRGRTASAPRRRAPRRARQTPAAGFAALPVVAVGRTAGAVGEIADSGVMVRMARSRAWIGVLGALLAGIVALNVFGLSMRAGVSDTAARAERLQRENSVLSERIGNRVVGGREDPTKVAVPAADDADDAAVGPGTGVDPAAGAIAADPVPAEQAPADAAPVESDPEPAPTTAPPGAGASPGTVTGGGTGGGGGTSGGVSP